MHTVQYIATRTQTLCCPIKLDMKHATATVGTEHMVMPRFEAGVGKPNAKKASVQTATGVIDLKVKASLCNAHRHTSKHT